MTMIPEMDQQAYLDRMLGALRNTEDKSPNSFSYDNLSAVAFLAEDIHRLIAYLAEQFDIENIEGRDLETRIYQIAGLTRKQPTIAHGLAKAEGQPGARIPKGTLLKAGSTDYTTRDDYVIMEDGTTKIEFFALASGGEGNLSRGIVLKPSPRPMGLTKITTIAEVNNGYDMESDDDFRERFYDKLQNPPKAGNPSHYKLWAEEIDGIGGAKVFRTWKGPSTVKVVVVGMDRKGVDADMIKTVKDHIMLEAPIHWEDLTVESAKEIPMEVKLKLTIQPGFALEDVKRDMTEAIDEYLYTVAFSQSFVSFAKVGGHILATPGVKDYEDLTINGKADNLVLADTDVATLSGIEVIA